ncbi:Translation factor GUF1 like, mitochondrial [Echinococcus multilocularis]|uniref:Translation factor GUF1 like, mitochondrial n=1 Tax=Echinococcus multilocularis TaxID=6211 RepID=A0A0S4MPE5_ECHMU|nr:Translation factor GUF1 like, mitochondrial [Echinococcus multilocularis]
MNRKGGRESNFSVLYSACDYAQLHITTSEKIYSQIFPKKLAQDQNRQTLTTSPYQPMTTVPPTPERTIKHRLQRPNKGETSPPTPTPLLAATHTFTKTCGANPTTTTGRCLFVAVGL